ncbi:hypothetical protein Tco_0207675 [Tanacetum coccineum]
MGCAGCVCTTIPKQSLPSLCLDFISAIEGVRWVECFARGEGYRVIGLWERVRVSCEGTWEVVWQEKPWERAGMDLAVNGGSTVVVSRV